MQKGSGLVRCVLKAEKRHTKLNGRALPFKQVMEGSWIYDGELIDGLHTATEEQLRKAVRISYNHYRRVKRALDALPEDTKELLMIIHISALDMAEREYRHVKREVREELKRRS